MTRTTQIAMTLTLDGEEQDVEARADVDIEPPDERYCRAYAQVSGDVEVLVGKTWHDADALTLAPGDHERIVERLRVQALEDWRDGEYARADHYVEARSW